MTEYSRILARASKYKGAMVRLLRELVAIPSATGSEGRVVQRIRSEMKSLGAFDRIRIDKFGNLLGWIGNGPRLIAIDAHVDTVGVGDRAAWKHDPFTGKLEKGIVYGRGAGDQKGAVPGMLYAARIVRELGLRSDEWTLLMTFTVAEEDCDGLNWQYIVRESGIRPDCVVVTDSTNCKILRGQRGRMEIGVTIRGKSCHGSMPHKGDNAAYKAARVVREIEKLNGKLKKDTFLGNGTIAVTKVQSSGPSLCAIPDRAYLHLDRRLTTGDSKASALREVRDAVRRAGVKATVSVCRYDTPTYTGLSYPAESYFPTWCESEDAPQVRAAVAAYRGLFGGRPKVGRWTFSTNGVSIAGMFGIPCVGFGPAAEDVAHTVNDSVPVEHLVKSAAFYAAFPQAYCDQLR